jgi:predicted nucleotidyltransferase
MTTNILPIELLEKALGCRWQHLEEARHESIALKKRLSDKILGIQVNDETSIITYGSLARNEFTKHSDIDWTLLVDGKVSSEHRKIGREANNIVKSECSKAVGRENTFGGISYSHDLVHKIGGNEDTNKNTTQRILILLESYPLGNNKAYDRVKREVLCRYVKEDWGIWNTQIKVPRFLLNDIARYWRTMCVDFAYKRRDRDNEEWALKTLKLRFSRKLIYVSGLLSCFSCISDITLAHQLRSINDVEEQRELIIDHLAQITSHSPLDIFSEMILPHEDLYNAAKVVMDSYNDFVGILSDNEYRLHLKELSPIETNTDKFYNETRELGHKFQDGLDEIFLSDNSSMFFSLTKKYGVF